jgi:hypothetical protein
VNHLPNVMYPVPGWEGYYIMLGGALFSRWVNAGTPTGTPKEMRPKIDKDGYMTYCVRRSKGKFRSIGAHYLLLLTFVGPPPSSRHQACHNDGDPLNNVLSNLRWDTPAGNQRDRVAHGTDSRGEKQGAVKLTEAAVREVRERARAGATQRSLAREFKVSPSQVGRIVHRTSWSYFREEGT